MDDSQIKNLLGKMDAASTQPALNPQLASNVRRRASRRTNFRRFSLVLGFTIIGAFLVNLVAHNRQHSQPVRSNAIASDGLDYLRAAGQLLSAQAFEHEQLAAQLEQLESISTLRKQIGEGPIIRLSIDRAAAAGILTFRANQLARDRSFPQAIAEYQRVISQFSETPQARFAEQRLREIKSSSINRRKLNPYLTLEAAPLQRVGNNETHQSTPL